MVLVPTGKAEGKCDRLKQTACLQFNGSIAHFGKKKIQTSPNVTVICIFPKRSRLRRLKQSSLSDLPDFAILVRFTRAEVAKLADALA